MSAATEACPCRHSEPFAECCGAVIGGRRKAVTAAQLMRSRYTAFAIGDEDYLLRSWHPRTRPDHLELDPDQQWYLLEVLRTERGGLLENDGIVEFRAHYRHFGERHSLHETSRFVRENGSWLYVSAR